MAPIDDLYFRMRQLEETMAALLGDQDLADAYLGKHARYSHFRMQRFQMESTVAEVKKDVSRYEERLTSLMRDNKRLLADAHSIFAIQSMGLDLDKTKIPRFLPVRIYLDRDDPQRIPALEKAVEDLMKTFGLAIEDDFPAETGSWFKKMFFRFEKPATQKEVRDIARKVKRGIELVGLEDKQADINKKQADCIGLLLERAKDFANVAIQCGTALVVVTTAQNGHKNVVGITLTAVQVIALENNQELLRSPATLLSELQRICAGHVEQGKGEDDTLLN